MPKKRALSRDEKLDRRDEIARRAATGTLRLPEAIRDIRDALGMTQTEFADKFGLTRTQLIDLEKGRANPTHETLARIGKPFGFVLGFVPRTPSGEVSELRDTDRMPPRGQSSA
ncbi:helix-turn-helix protein [mine drainage metagenome]|uniref:Helix-turn-helix protein n=1 Tax=mine drainage metagenome TaxID=410659 RepID=A0A1J5QS63_9ZZZZ